MELFLLAVFRDVLRHASMTLNYIAPVLPLVSLCWPRLLTVWLLSKRCVILLGQLIFLQHKYPHWRTQLKVNCMKFLKAFNIFFCSLVCHNAQVRLRNWKLAKYVVKWQLGTLLGLCFSFQTETKCINKDTLRLERHFSVLLAAVTKEKQKLIGCQWDRGAGVDTTWK